MLVQFLFIYVISITQQGFILFHRSYKMIFYYFQLISCHENHVIHSQYWVFQLTTMVDWGVFLFLKQTIIILNETENIAQNLVEFIVLNPKDILSAKLAQNLSDPIEINVRLMPRCGCWCLSVYFVDRIDVDQQLLNYLFVVD